MIDLPQIPSLELGSVFGFMDFDGNGNSIDYWMRKMIRQEIIDVMVYDC